MAYTVVVHVPNADPFVAEIEELPDPSDQYVTLSNPRLRDGKPLPYIEDGVATVLFPWHRISFIEVMPSEEERGEIEAFFRE